MVTTAIKFSIIIPTWNRSELLKLAIESVLKQDYCSFDVIVADNASSDCTSVVMQKYILDPRVQYIRNTHNIGPRANFNKALMQYSTGEFVLVLSDDDKLTDSTYLSKVARLIESDPEIVLVFANFRYINMDNGSVLSVTNSTTPQAVIDGRWLWLNYNIHAWCPLLTTFFSREQAMKVGGFFLDIPAVDMLMFLHIMLNGKVGFIPDVVADYGVHRDNASKSKEYLNNLESAYENLDRIRITSRYARKIGIEDSCVNSWKQRMMIHGLRQIIWDFCIGPALQGNFGPFTHVQRLANQHGENEYLHQAMVFLTMVLAERAGLKENYRKMDLTL